MAKVLVLAVVSLLELTWLTPMCGATGATHVKRYDNSKNRGTHNYGFTYNIGGVGGPASRYSHQEIRNDDHTQGQYEVQLPSGSNQRVSYTISESSRSTAPTSAHTQIISKNKEKSNINHSKENQQLLKKRLVNSKTNNKQRNIKQATSNSKQATVNVMQATRPPRATTSFFNLGRNSGRKNTILGKSVSTSTSSVSSRVSVGTESSHSNNPFQISDSNRQSTNQAIHGTARTITDRHQILQSIGRDVNTGFNPRIVQVNNKPALLVPSRPVNNQPKVIRQPTVTKQTVVNSKPAVTRQPTVIKHPVGISHSTVNRQTTTNFQPVVNKQSTGIRQPAFNRHSSLHPFITNSHQGIISRPKIISPSQLSILRQQPILPQQPINSATTITQGNVNSFVTSSHLNTSPHIINPILSHINDRIAFKFRSRPVTSIPQQVFQTNQNISPNLVTTISQPVSSLTTSPDGRLSLLVPSRPVTSSQQSFKSDSTQLSIQKATPITFSIPSSTGTTNVRAMNDMRVRLNQVLIELFSDRSRHQKSKNVIPVQTVNPPIESNIVEPNVSWFSKKSNFVKPIESKFLKFQRQNPRNQLLKSKFKAKHAKLFSPQTSRRNKTQDTIVTLSPVVRSFTIQTNLNDHEKIMRTGRDFGSPEILAKLGLTGLSQLARNGRVTSTKVVPFATFRL